MKLIWPVPSANCRSSGWILIELQGLPSMHASSLEICLQAGSKRWTVSRQSSLKKLVIFLKKILQMTAKPAVLPVAVRKDTSNEHPNLTNRRSQGASWIITASIRMNEAWWPWWDGHRDVRRRKRRTTTRNQRILSPELTVVNRLLKPLKVTIVSLIRPRSHPSPLQLRAQVEALVPYPSSRLKRAWEPALRSKGWKRDNKME